MKYLQEDPLDALITQLSIERTEWLLRSQTSGLASHRVIAIVRTERGGTARATSYSALTALQAAVNQLESERS